MPDPSPLPLEQFKNAYDWYTYEQQRPYVKESVQDTCDVSFFFSGSHTVGYVVNKTYPD